MLLVSAAIEAVKKMNQLLSQDPLSRKRCAKLKLVSIMSGTQDLFHPHTIKLKFNTSPNDAIFTAKVYLDIYENIVNISNFRLLNDHRLATCIDVPSLHMLCFCAHNWMEDNGFMTSKKIGTKFNLEK